MRQEVYDIFFNHKTTKESATVIPALSSLLAGWGWEGGCGTLVLAGTLGVITRKGSSLLAVLVPHEAVFFTAARNHVISEIDSEIVI